MQLRRDIFISIPDSSAATEGNKGIFQFFSSGVNGPPGAGLRGGMDVFIIGRRVDAGFLTDQSSVTFLHWCSCTAAHECFMQRLAGFGPCQAGFAA